MGLTESHVAKAAPSGIAGWSFGFFSGGLNHEPGPTETLQLLQEDVKRFGVYGCSQRCAVLSRSNPR